MMALHAASSLLALGGPLQAYRSLLASGALLPDPAQLRAATALNRLFSELVAPPTTPAPTRPPLGVYLHGGVGRGKTLLMDLFHASLAASSLRVHSHAYFLSLHAALHASRKGGAAAVDSAAGSSLGPACRVLCLDEVEISDIANAVLMRRVHTALCVRRVALVATSNAAPEGLYYRGLNRELIFAPFEKELRGSSEVVSLDEADSAGQRDFRRVVVAVAPSALSAADSGNTAAVPAAAASALPPPYLLLHPLNPDTEAALNAVCAVLSKARPLAPLQLPIPSLSRSVHIPLASPCGTLARFSFSQLCAANLSAADFLAIAQRFPALALTGIPAPPARNADMLRRLITLVDVLYEARTLLVTSGEGNWGALLAPAVEDGGGDRERAAVAAALGMKLEEEGELEDSSSKSGSAPPLSVPPSAAAAVLGEGGSSGRSTLYIGAVEWSATGRSGASLAEVGRGTASFVSAAAARCESRLEQMSRWEWAEAWGVRQGVDMGGVRAALAAGGRGSAGGVEGAIPRV